MQISRCKPGSMQARKLSIAAQTWKWAVVPIPWSAFVCWGAQPSGWCDWEAIRFSPPPPFQAQSFGVLLAEETE